MKEYLRIFAKVALAVFCVWHMTAVALYSIPGDAKDRISTWLRENATPRIANYMLITSQWQQWNLFSPNPLRRVIFYRIETLNAQNNWAYVASVNDHTYRPWRHSSRFKLLGQALEENTNRPELAERAAQVLCNDFRMEDGAKIRIWRDLTIVPYKYPSPSKAWWDSWIPQFESSLAIETVCQP